MSHALSNGRGALQWVVFWIAAASGESVPVGETAGHFKSTAPLAGLAALPFYILNYFARAGLNPARETVNLSHGKTPIPHDNGYASATYRLSAPETDRVLAKARALELSPTQYICLAVAEAMLSAQPDKSRVSIAVPTDLARYSPGFPRSVPGNYTGSLMVQLRRGAPLQSQIARQFRWLRMGIDYWLNRLAGAFSRDEQKFIDNVARAASRPVDQRGRFAVAPTCIVTNLGVIATPASWGIESGTGATKTQSILFTIFTLNGCLITNVTFPRDLYEADEVFRVADAAIGVLSERGSAAGKADAAVS